MAPPHIIAVCAAAGLQGRSVAKHFLSKPELYKVRALVRSVDSDVSEDLKARGAELHLANQDDLQSLNKAFRGAEAVFAYTSAQSWGPPKADTRTETELGKNIVDACKSQDVKWLAWTSCPSAEKYTNGEMSIAAYEEKSAVDEYIRQTNVPGSILLVASFLENITNYHWIKQSGGGELTFNTPIVPADHPQAWTSVSHDMGPIAETVFASALGWHGQNPNSSKWLHREVNTCCQWASTTQIKDAIAKASGVAVHQNVASKEVLLKVAPHLAPAVPIFEFVANYVSMPDPNDSAKLVSLPDEALVEEGLQLDTIDRWAREDVLSHLRGG